MSEALLLSISQRRDMNFLLIDRYKSYTLCGKFPLDAVLDQIKGVETYGNITTYDKPTLE